MVVTYQEGCLVDGWVLVSNEWLSARHVSDHESDYQPGDVANDHVWTGENWIPVIPSLEVSTGREPTKREQRIAEFRARQATQETIKAEMLAMEWPESTLMVGKLSNKAKAAILRQCHDGEYPWLILTSSGGKGTLTAFEDRLAIIKTGALTSLMAGSLGGERSATFYFTDVTGIEYNSGFVTGVLEVLTASYSGTANKDYWRGSNKSRNADSNDPWTLSNCLPLDKLEYESSLRHLNDLKARVARAKAPVINVITQSTTESGGLAEQLEKLAKLHESGVLSADEFAAAKARLLG
jgi:hypothetical protein